MYLHILLSVISNKLMIQWSNFTGDGSLGSVNITLPTSFSNYCILVAATTSIGDSNSWSNTGSCSLASAMDYGSFVYQAKNNVSNFKIRNSSSRKYICIGY